MTKHWRETSMTWGKRIILVILILIGIVYGVLSLAQKSVEPMRLGLQDFLYKTTGHPAEITDLSTLKLVPNLEFLMKTVLIRDRADQKKIIAKAEQAYVALPFWRVVIGSGDYLGFEIKNLETSAGFFLPLKLKVDFMGISDSLPQKASPMFLIEGRYNERDLLITAEMIRRNKKAKALYSFDDKFPITFKLGELEGSGTFERGFTKVSLKDISLVHGENTAQLSMTNFKTDPLMADLEGEINGVPFKGKFVELNGKQILNITPLNIDKESLRKIDSFVSVLKADLGITQGVTSFEIITNQSLADTSPNDTETK